MSISLCDRDRKLATMFVQQERQEEEEEEDVGVGDAIAINCPHLDAHGDASAASIPRGHSVDHMLLDCLMSPAWEGTLACLY